MKKCIKKTLLFALAGILLAGLLTAGAMANQENMGAELGYIHVLNTGWEDTIILESDGRFAVVDAGMPGRGPYIMDYLQRRAGAEDVHLDFIIATHSHIDHMGGFVDQTHDDTFREGFISLPNVTIGKAYAKRENNQNADGTIGGRLYRAFLAGCAEKGIEVVQDGLDNLELLLGNMKVTLVNGAPFVGGTTNPESMCQLVEAGDYKALLAADMVSNKKELGVYKQIGGTVDFLKIGHHGMGDSTGVRFARNLRPKVAVYTNGNSWNVGSQDATLSTAKNISGYNNLRRVGAAQYVTTDIGGLMAVFGENGMDYRAIKEFTIHGDYEYREDIILRRIAPPALGFFQGIAVFFEDIWYRILNLFGR